MNRSIPVIPTLIVAAAVATMIALGFWQLGRADEKAALIERYTAAAQLTDPVAFPREQDEVDDRLYRFSEVDCRSVVGQTTKSARSAAGRSGIGQVATCETEAGVIDVVLGWSREPGIVEYDGGSVNGWIAPLGEGAQLVADPALGGLEPIARPDPLDTPNNHLAYAGQWFFFALTALAIYVLAVRRRRNG